MVADADTAEAERLLLLALRSDIATGRIEWSGRYLVNPSDASGLVSEEEIAKLCLRSWMKVDLWLLDLAVLQRRAVDNG